MKISLSVSPTSLCAVTMMMYLLPAARLGIVSVLKLAIVVRGRTLSAIFQVTLYNDAYIALFQDIVMLVVVADAALSRVGFWGAVWNIHTLFSY